MTPLARYQQDLSRIRPLGPLAGSLDALFQHRVTRLVRKDGTVSYQGQRFEVPSELSGKTVSLVVDPHTETVIGVEDEKGKRSARRRHLMRWPMPHANDASLTRRTLARPRKGRAARI